MQVNLTGDMIISAGIIAYLGAFTAAFRAQLVEGFVSLCKSQVGNTTGTLLLRNLHACAVGRPSFTVLRPHSPRHLHRMAAQASP
jgi:hypothetical protein